MASAAGTPPERQSRHIKFLRQDISPDLDQLLRYVAAELEKEELESVVKSIKNTFKGEFEEQQDEDLYSCLLLFANQGLLSGKNLTLLEGFIASKSSKNKGIKQRIENFKAKRQQELLATVEEVKGRRQDLEDIITRLGGTKSIVNLFGSSGEGKTTLSKEIVLKWPGKHRILVDLREVTEIKGIYFHIMLALDSKRTVLTYEENPVMEHLRKLKEEGQGDVLLVLDNADHFSGGVDEKAKGLNADFIGFLGRLLTEKDNEDKAQLKVLLISRRRFQRGEKMQGRKGKSHSLDEIMECKELKILEKEVSMEIFQKASGISTTAAVQMEQLIEMCKRKPLLLNGMAAILRQKIADAEELLKTIEQGLDASESEEKVVPMVKESTEDREVWDYRTDGIDEGQLSCLKKMFFLLPSDILKYSAVAVSLFCRPFSVEAAAFVLDTDTTEAIIHLEGLRNSQLLSADPEAKEIVYDIHPLMRSYIRRVGNSPVFKHIYMKAKHRFCDLYMKKMKDVATLVDKDYLRAFDQFDFDKPNFDLALDISFSLDYLHISNEYQERIMLCHLFEAMLDANERRNVFKLWAEAAVEDGKEGSLFRAELKCQEALQVLDIQGWRNAMDVLKSAEDSLNRVGKEYENTDLYILTRSSFLYSEGEINYRKENISNALKSLFDSLGKLEEILKNHTRTTRCLNAIGNCYNYLGNFESALEFYTKAYEMRKKLSGSRNHLDLPFFVGQIGTVYDGLKQYDKAIKCYEKAIELSKELKRSGILRLALFYRNIANSYAWQKEFEKAYKLAMTAYEIRKDILGNHPHTARSAFQLGEISKSLEKFDEAEEFLEEAWEIEKSLGNGNHSAVRDRIVNSYQAILQGKSKEAFETEALEFYQRLWNEKEDFAYANKTIIDEINERLSNSGDRKMIRRYKEEALKFYEDAWNSPDLQQQPDVQREEILQNILHLAQSLRKKEMHTEYQHEAFEFYKRQLLEKTTMTSRDRTDLLYRLQDLSKSLGDEEKAKKYRELCEAQKAQCGLQLHPPGDDQSPPVSLRTSGEARATSFDSKPQIVGHLPQSDLQGEIPGIVGRFYITHCVERYRLLLFGQPPMAYTVIPHGVPPTVSSPVKSQKSINEEYDIQETVSRYQGRRNLGSLRKNASPDNIKGVIKEGFLIKGQRGRNARENRYFVLHNRVLYYFKDENSPMHQGEISLPGHKVVFASGCKFDLYHPLHRIFLEFETSDEKETREWITAIQAAADAPWSPYVESSLNYEKTGSVEPEKTIESEKNLYENEEDFSGEEEVHSSSLTCNRKASMFREQGEFLILSKGSCSPWTTRTFAGIITCEGGEVIADDVLLKCPPGAVKSALHIKVSLEDPSEYYSLILQRDLEHDVRVCAPIISLQPRGYQFMKPVKLSARFKIGDFKRDGLFILHGTQQRDGEITWQDMTPHVSINETLAAVEVTIEIEGFSIIAAFLRLSFILTKDVVTRLNLLPFSYTVAVLVSEEQNELALLFVSQDVFNETFYRNHESSELVKLRAQGFMEVHVRSVGGQDEKRIYNSESLQVSICIGEDYKFVDGQSSCFQLTVESYVWWSTGHVIRLLLEKAEETRILCGQVSIKGEHGHCSERHFCQQDLNGYVMELLEVKGEICNLLPIARKFKMPEESVAQIVKYWRDDDQQLEKILQYWMTDKDIVEDHKALRKELEGLQQDCRVARRGKMHVRHLKETAAKFLGSEACGVRSLASNLASTVPGLCKSILQDCCIELEDYEEGMERAASSSKPLRYLAMRRALPDDLKRDYQRICLSKSNPQCIRDAFLSIVPDLIQTVKEVFTHEKISQVQNGLRGVSDEALEELRKGLRDAEKNNRSRQLVCEMCRLLEQLCLENCHKHSTTEIKKWGNSLAFLSMLEFLKPFFLHCPQNIRLYKRLELISSHFRDIMSDLRYTTNQHFVRDLFNVSESLISFAEFDPSKLVRFVLSGLTDSSLNCSMIEILKYDRHNGTFSQRFHIKKESDDELQIQAFAFLHIDGQVRTVGAFQSVVKLSVSGEAQFDKCVGSISGVSVAKQEDKDSENYQVVLCSTKEEKLLEALNVIRGKVNQDFVSFESQEITPCNLTMRSDSARKDSVLSLNLVYKLGSKAVSLEGSDFVPFPNSSTDDACIPHVQLMGLTAPEKNEEACKALVQACGDGTSFALDMINARQIQKHTTINCDKIEYHFHKTENYVKSHNCVVGDRSTLNDQSSSERALQEERTCDPRRSITDGKR